MHVIAKQLCEQELEEMMVEASCDCRHCEEPDMDVRQFSAMNILY